MNTIFRYKFIGSEERRKIKVLRTNGKKLRKKQGKRN